MALNINGTTGISGVDGSVSAPAVTGTDSNTGITFPSADTIKFSTGGVERMSITNSGISGITSGITMHDVWLMTSQLSVPTGQSDVSSNWSRGNAINGVIGSAMTQSSGVFTFPSTGIYLITINGNFIESGSGGHNYVGFYTQYTTNNSSYSTGAFGATNIAAFSGSTYGFVTFNYTFDVTNVSTHKIKFATIASSSTMVLSGASSYNDCWAEFTRLGDT